MGQGRDTAKSDEPTSVYAGRQTHQHPQWRSRVHSLVSTGSLIHCILALHLEHLLLATRTSSSSSSFNLNKHCPVDFYVLNAHPTCTTKLILPRSSKVISKQLKTLMFCRYPGPNQPTWPNLCKSVAQNSTLGLSRLVLGFSQLQIYQCSSKNSRKESFWPPSLSFEEVNHNRS